MIALILAYCLVFKVLLGPALALAATGTIQSEGPFVVCASHLSHAGDRSEPGKTPASSCCDDNCCMVCSVDIAAPPLDVWEAGWAQRPVAVKIRYDGPRAPTGPPLRIAAAPHAQRAPPIS